MTEIAVVGSGYWGKNLVRNFADLGVLRMICDKDRDRLSGFHPQYPDVTLCLSPHEAFQHDGIDAVVIATPAESHFDIAREALLAGKHVYIEKPFVLRTGDGAELVALAERLGRVLMVGHLLRYHSAFRTLLTLVRKGDLGRIDYIYSTRLNLGKIRREENILWSFAPHDISMILALTGEMPERVSTSGGNYLHRKIADVTVTNFSFPSGIKAHVFVSWLHPYKEQKLVVVGEKKMAVFNDLEPWDRKLVLYPHQIEWNNQVPTPSRADEELIDLESTEPLREACLEFLDCIDSGRPPETDGSEGLRVLKVLKSSQRSLDKKGLPVGLEKAAQAQDGTTCFVHPTAVVEKTVAIGKGTKVWHFSHLLDGTHIGQGCNIGQNVVVGPDVEVGNGCKIQNNVSIYKGVTLEDHVFCGPSMVFTNVHVPRAHIPRMDALQPTLVRQGATLGANCTVVCGVTIGRYAFVGAGAVVTRDVPDHALVIGNPARVEGWVCECGYRLDADDRCPACNNRYVRKAGQGLAESP